MNECTRTERERELQKARLIIRRARKEIRLNVVVDVQASRVLKFSVSREILARLCHGWIVFSCFRRDEIVYRRPGQ